MLTHVVSLQSLEEDRLGEELDVVWELEVGHTVASDQGLPDRIAPGDFDDPNLLAAFVDAVRWGAVTSADENAYQSPFRSGANIEAYQLEPLRRALQSSRTNLLLADDVGLGKTIEAGMVVQELLLRHRARSVVIVCPPSLALKWQDEMREKFGLEFVIVNSDLMAQVRRSHGLAANPFRLFPRVIVSMSWLPSPRAQRLLRQVYAEVRNVRTARRFAFDLLVVDEAHHVAPANPTAGVRGYAVDSQRTIATRDLAERCEHRLFLSATPHNGYPESFTALMEMIDDRRFTRGARLDDTALKAVTVRRLKSALPDKDFKPRKLKVVPFTPSDDEQEKFALLDRILRASAEANGRRHGGDILAMLLKKRFLSSPWSFGCTLDRYRGTPVGRGISEEGSADLYLDLVGSGQDDEEEGEADHPEFEALRQSKGSDPLVAAKRHEIDGLVDWGLSYEHRADSRLSTLCQFLDSVCRPDGRTWSNERVVVFTEYAATLDWIVDVLEQRGYADVLSVIKGSTPSEEREDIRARFSEHPAKEPVRVLVATDSAGEGIDLQAHCHRLVNFDIPFNPSRLEQRIGRIDRYGQASTPEVYQLTPDRTSSTYAADLDFLRRIAEKVGNVAHDLGSVNQVIDSEIQERFAPTTASAKRQRKATPEDGNAQINRALAGELELNRRLTELATSYHERKVEMHLLPGNARRVVDTALALTAQPPLDLGGHERTDAAVFNVPSSLSPAWEHSLHVGRVDTRLEPGVWRSITFDDVAARQCGGEVAHVHLGHPLLQRSARILRSKLFGIGSEIHRVTAVVVDDLPQSCVAAVSRLVLVGRGGLRLHEQVFLTGIRIHGQDMAEEKVEALLDRSLDDESMTPAGEELRVGLAESWNARGSRMRSRLLRAMEHRADRLQQQVTARLQNRRESDTARAREIFAAFRQNLLDSRDRLVREIASEDEMLFTDDQQAQRRRDLRAMEDRLASLDEELGREVVSIEERYADVRAHVSAAAVVFALTPADAAAGRTA
jgi:superfamily II DNA or RNA helicase